MDTIRVALLICAAHAFLAGPASCDEDKVGTVSVRGGPPVAVPTFECIGVYWSPRDGDVGRTCTVSYRRAGGAKITEKGGRVSGQ